MASECRNCGRDVSDAYARVFAPEEADGVGCCPRCDDMVRTPGGRPRQKAGNWGEQQ